MEFLKELHAEVLKAELLAFLENTENEEFKEQLIHYIEEDFSYGDCE